MRKMRYRRSIVSHPHPHLRYDSNLESRLVGCMENNPVRHELITRARTIRRTISVVTPRTIVATFREQKEVSNYNKNINRGRVNHVTCRHTNRQGASNPYNGKDLYITLTTMVTRNATIRLLMSMQDHEMIDQSYFTFSAHRHVTNRINNPYYFQADIPRVSRAYRISRIRVNDQRSRTK